MIPNSEKNELVRLALRRGDYSVDEDGAIWSHKTAIPRKLKATTLENEYMILNLRVDRRSLMVYVHRIVALAKLLPPLSEDATQVNHIDGRKWNNSPKNLEWVTPSENVIHCIKNGLRAPWGFKRASGLVSN